MTWSLDTRVMIRPFRVYSELAGAEPQEGFRTAIERAVFLLLVIGAFVSFTTAGRLVAFHVASTMIFWSFVPLVQAALFAAVLRVIAPRARLSLGLALYFAGHGPWLIFLMMVAGVCFFTSDVAASFFAMLRTGVLPAFLLGTWIWSGVLTFACFRAGMGLSRARAGLATALFYTGYVVAIVSYYLAMNSIQPQVGVHA